MDISEFAHTKKEVIDKVYNLYLQGLSVEEISIWTEMTREDVDGIIDCRNLYL